MAGLVSGIIYWFVCACIILHIASLTNYLPSRLSRVRVSFPAPIISDLYEVLANRNILCGKCGDFKTIQYINKIRCNFFASCQKKSCVINSIVFSKLYKIYVLNISQIVRGLCGDFWLGFGENSNLVFSNNLEYATVLKAI